MPHLVYLALTGADPERQIPIPIWMHRGCVPFVSYDHFENIYWATLRPIVDALWAQGNQVLFYAEGKWDPHLETFAELPAGSIVYHIDRGDPSETHRVLGKKFCLSGGVPNALLAFGKPEEVRAHCRKLIETIGADGGYIMDASAIMQNDATIENLRAMTDAAVEFGEYRSPSSPSPAVPKPSATAGIPGWVTAPKPQPGVCMPFDRHRLRLPDPLPGDETIVRRIWDEVEGLGYLYIWHLVLSF
jgi:hypothetical protein